MKFVPYLQQAHPPAERKDVLLFLKECERHVDWYAPEFTRYYSPLFPFAKVDPALLMKARAIYTDDPIVVDHRALATRSRRRIRTIFVDRIETAKRSGVSH